MRAARSQSTYPWARGNRLKTPGKSDLELIEADLQPSRRENYDRSVPLPFTRPWNAPSVHFTESRNGQHVLLMLVSTLRIWHENTPQF
jgi:hypothetical protein